MKLKKLEIHGFKSFADRTVIHFDAGITIVVGPNGCGKSNIVDSLRWCMGEQSAKHLRGDGMQDVIFNGSDARGPSGMAEVSLTFLNEGDVAGEFSAYPEITISRRLYRNGDSDYLINKQVVRLKDVQDLVLGTGVGSKGYSIIEQGRIGMIVSAKPEDRRRLIEEAAGITKYKARRQAAERKMDATRQNLVRVNDLVTELGKRLGTLRRQAAKAEKFKALRGELRELDLHDATLEHLRLTALSVVDRQAIADLEDQGGADQARLAVLEADGEVARLQLLDDEKRIQELQTRLYAADQEIRLLEQNAAHHDDTSTQLLRRASDAETEMAGQRGRLTVVSEEAGRLQRDLGSLQAEVDQSDEATGQAAQELEELKARRDELQAEVDAARAAQGDLRAQESAAQTHLDQLARRTAELAEREARARGEQENLEAEAEAVLNSKRLGTASVNARREEKAELETQRQQIATELGEASERLRIALTRVNQAQEELGKRRQRMHGLEEIHTSLTRAPEGVRAVMEWKKEAVVEGIHGLLADAVESPARLEAAVATALGPHLDDVVVESPEVAAELARRLSRDQKGRAVLVPRTPRGTPFARTAVEAEGVVGWLVDELKVEETLRPAVDARLGDVLVVKELKHARALVADAAFHARVVTLQGELIDEVGAIVGGSADEAAQTFLRQKREITELAGEIAGMEEALKEVDNERARLHFQVEDLRVRERDVNEESQTVALRLVEAEKDLHRLADQESRMLARKDALMSEMTRITELTTELRMEERGHQETLERARAELLRHEQEMQLNVERLSVMQGQFMLASERATELRVRAQSARDRREHLERSIASHARSHTEIEELLGRLTRQALESREESGRLVAQAAQEREKALSRAGEVNALRGALEGNRSTYEEAQRRVAGLESEARVLRNAVGALQGQLTTLKVDLREKEMALTHLHARILEVHQVRLAEVMVDYHLRPLPDADTTERVTDLRRQIDNMGEINLTAIDECRDVEERHTFLSNQQDDLTHALNQLERAIQKINKTTKRRFHEAFEAINAKFTEVFPRLFRGGKAWLQMTNPEDLLETGIEIFAQPPGKKVQSVQLLSGGEKALTAVSLVFSIFLIKPSPFCLLDEVDAPLDEANVTRFNELVRDVSALSQFIIITHNKRTMEIADNLYGITMEEPGISKLVNVRVNVAEMQVQAPRSLAAPAPG